MILTTVDITRTDRASLEQAIADYEQAGYRVDSRQIIDDGMTFRYRAVLVKGLHTAEDRERERDGASQSPRP